eukprot:3007971-Rhodomonas_salina.1
MHGVWWRLLCDAWGADMQRVVWQSPTPTSLSAAPPAKPSSRASGSSRTWRTRTGTRCRPPTSTVTASKRCVSCAP